jgi:hypothetical protein
VTSPGGVISAVRGAVGVCELCWAPQAAQLVRAPDTAGRTLMVIRVLGARQVVQAVATQLRTTPTILLSGAVVDCLHAASLIALSLAKRRWRRAALPEAVLAICGAIASVAAAGALPRRPQPHPLRRFGPP